MAVSRTTTLVNRELWALARTLPSFGRRRYFQRLLHEREPRLRAELPTEHRAIVERMDTLLADPFYRDFRIYVHKLGVQSVGYHIVRLLDRNPRTPYRIGLALHNVDTTLMARYLDYRLDACRRGDAAATAALRERAAAVTCCGTKP